MYNYMQEAGFDPKSISNHDQEEVIYERPTNKTFANEVIIEQE